MKRICLLALLTGIVTSPAASIWRAPWIETQITPKSVDFYDRVFDIRVKDVDDHFRQFDIVVAVKPGQKMLSPFASGHLSLITADDYAAQVPVEMRWEKGKAKFWFRISRKAIESSKFEIREQGWAPLRNDKGEAQKDAAGKPMYEMTLGGQAFWFALKDFALSATSAERRRE